MQVLNGTPSTVVLYFDGLRYDLTGLEVHTVPEEAGEFFTRRYGFTGIMEVRFGDDPTRAKLHCLSRRRDWLKRALDHQERANALQAVKKFDPLPESQITATARRELPILEKHIAELEKRLGVSADPVQAELEEAVQADIEQTDAQIKGKSVHLKMLSMDELHRLANERGIAFDVKWNRKTLIAEIERHENAA